MTCKDCGYGDARGQCICPDKRTSGKFVVEIDMVNHPPHYTSSGATCDKCGDCIECIEVTRHMPFNIGNAVKYLWRWQDKGGLEDLKKARWYLEDAIKDLERRQKNDR